MKYYVLDPEEQEIENALAIDKARSAKSSAEDIRKLKKAAVYTLSKTKNINIRLSHKVVLGLKAKAIAEGIPYQTLASSVLHKYVSQADRLSI